MIVIAHLFDDKFAYIDPDRDIRFNFSRHDQNIYASWFLWNVDVYVKNKIVYTSTEMTYQEAQDIVNRIKGFCTFINSKPDLTTYLREHPRYQCR